MLYTLLIEGNSNLIVLNSKRFSSYIYSSKLTRYKSVIYKIL